MDSFLKMLCHSWPNPDHGQVFHVPTYNPMLAKKRLFEISVANCKRCMANRGDKLSTVVAIMAYHEEPAHWKLTATVVRLWLCISM